MIGVLLGSNGLNFILTQQVLTSEGEAGGCRHP